MKNNYYESFHFLFHSLLRPFTLQILKFLKNVYEILNINVYG